MNEFAPKIEQEHGPLEQLTDQLAEFDAATKQEGQDPDELAKQVLEAIEDYTGNQ